MIVAADGETRVDRVGREGGVDGANTNARTATTRVEALHKGKYSSIRQVYHLPRGGGHVVCQGKLAAAG